MRIVTFDIETIGGFSRGVWDMNEMDLTMCCTHDTGTDSYDCFLKQELPRLWKLLEQADMLVGFNSDHFDIPILNKYYPGDLSKMRSIDLMKEVYEALGRRVKLEAIANGTFGTTKGGTGIDAMRWWREGKIEKVKEYCLMDVEITKRAFDYALKNNSLKYKELGQIKEVKLNTSKWLAGESRPLTQTLGF